MNTNILQTEKIKYPDCPYTAEINPNATFDGLLDTLDAGGSVYDYIGVHDSLVRAECFKSLAKITGIGYEVIYKKWLNCNDD